MQNIGNCFDSKQKALEMCNRMRRLFIVDSSDDTIWYVEGKNWPGFIPPA
jgi:hypothetical protein